MKCLVTGGAGFIGSNLIRLLIDRGHSVVVLDNLSSGYKENLAGFKIDLFELGDIRDRKSVDKVMNGVNTVFHLAASVGNKKSIEDPLFDASCNILGLINVLESMRAHSVKNIVFSSSAGIFGEPKYQPLDEAHPCEPDSPYGASKLGGEKLVLSYAKLHGFRSVALRYFNVFGPNQRFDAYGNVIPIFVSRALKGQNLHIYGDGSQTRDFIHVNDIAKINVLAGESKDISGTFNLGTGKSISINDLAKAVNELTGSKIKIQHESPRLGDVAHCTASIEKLKNSFLYTPSTNFQENLGEYINWMKSDPVSK
jgi:nucleoside-diphosphate-sugar epimerase